MSSGTPLRERIHSNSPEVRGDVWVPQATTPLRIAKRDSPQPQNGPPLARRQSSSYNHLRKNNLVSKSPFRSQIPTSANRPSSVIASPSRRVSGEKRPRPSSMHEQAENEHPLGFKRRQSKGFQGLLQKEPVTKSPFRKPSNETQPEQRHSSRPSQPIPIRGTRSRRAPSEELDDEEDLPPPPPPKQIFSSRDSPSPSRLPPASASPSRPSLVSKRLHGPRDVGINGRKARRKTVTFDETCDVMEFSVEDSSMEGPSFEWSNDNDDDHEYASDDAHHHPPNSENEESFDSSQAGDDSITGMVNSMLEDAEPQTPPHEEHSLPDDLDTEDGVPYGRTHHAERHAVAHQQTKEQEEREAEDVLRPLRSQTLSTPPSRSGTPIMGVSPGSQMPLGRSTHSERRKAQKEQEGADIAEDVRQLPPSPSPAKRNSMLPGINANRESLIPKFDLGHPNSQDEYLPAPSNEADPFGLPSPKQEAQTPELSFMSADSFGASREEELDPGNLSIGHSEVSLSGLDIEVDVKDAGSRQLDPDTDEGDAPAATSTPPTSPAQNVATLSHRLHNDKFAPSSINLDSPPLTLSALRSSAGSPSLSPRVGSPGISFSARAGSPLSPRVASPIPPRMASPIHRGLVKSSSSSSLGSPTSSVNGRSPRISRDEVQKRLLKKRSLESPMRELMDTTEDTIPEPSVDARKGSPKTPREVMPAMTRNTPTYDGIMSINPEPQPIDPPRPSLAARAHSADSSAFGPTASQAFAGLQLDFESGFDSGMDMGSGVGSTMGDMQFGDMRSALDRLMEDVAGSASVGPDGKGVTGLKVEAVTQGVKAGRFQKQPDGRESPVPQERDDADVCMDNEDTPESSPSVQNPTPDPVLLRAGFKSASPEAAPAPPPKDAIRAREELIKAKKREARRREQEEEEDEEAEQIFTPPRQSGAGRPGKRRSLSAGDAERISTSRSAKRHGKSKSANGLLGVPIEDEEDPLADSIDRELRKLGGPNQNKYRVREHSETIYASSDADPVSHMGSAGDIENGKAWRPVRRPSDMNEYSKQIKELRAQEKSGKAHGKVFVKVIGLKGLNVPIPQQPTAVTCTLNNGIHFVTTPECRLDRECRIGQEFELIEHSKLEFTLTLKIRRDPHVIAQFKANTPPPPPPPVQVAPPPASKGGMRSFFLGSSPKKPAKVVSRPSPPTPVHKLEENLARYLRPDGSLARAFISFKDIARHCDTRLFETTYPLIGQKLELGPTTKTMQVGEIVLQIFRLPPLPGIPPNQLPQSLEECHRGLRHIHWHKVTYFEGTLTQSGGDCLSWRRRQLRIVGSNLVAFNDVTKKATATIDLKKALAVEDTQDARAAALSPASGSHLRSSRYVDDYDGPYGVERSFRLVFPHDQEILFFADTDEEKARWLEVLRALVGRIPPNPLWAELVWQRQQELTKQAGTSSSQNRPISTPVPHR